ncbi:MAG: radical SAM protein [Bacillota bacterium]|jgi:pyruvate formate lyase activating enzyme
MTVKNSFRHRKKALFYEKFAGSDDVKCTLCPKYCFLKSGEIGECRVRSNRGGTLYSLNYGWIRVLNLENIEKIPLVEYYPSMNVLSLGSWGCNMHCSFCNNLQLIEGVGMGRVLYPNEAGEIANKLIAKDCIGMAYAFAEPAVWYEFVLDTCKEMKRYDMKNILSTNGCLNNKPWRYLLPHLDAVNLDIKSMDSEYYRNLGGSLETVLENAKVAGAAGVHLEITRVMVPGVNDSREDITALAMFIGNELGKNVPLHLLEHIPNGQTNYIRTPESDLVWAADLADKYLNNVYIGTP